MPLFTKPAGKTEADSDCHEKKEKSRFGKIAAAAALISARVLLCIFCFAVTLVLVLLAAGTVLCHGPSGAAKDFFVTTVTETSALKFLAKIYLSDDEISAIMAKSEEKGQGEITDPVIDPDPPDKPDPDEKDIEIITVSGDLYWGKLMIVKDPSRVSIFMLDEFSSTGRGLTLMEIYKQTGAVAVTNAGGFYDPEGMGKGGMPLGYAIRNGELVSYLKSSYSTIVGFDASHRLIVGKMTPEKAIGMGIVDAVSFGPVLVVNGNRAKISTSGALHPRTAIGQRADGAILLLVIDGRQPHSVGITYKGLQDIMVEYGAVNAANLDGGSSSMMIYEGNFITKHSSVVGPRPVPTAIVVK